MATGIRELSHSVAYCNAMGIIHFRRNQREETTYKTPKDQFREINRLQGNGHVREIGQLRPINLLPEKKNPKGRVMVGHL